MRKWGILIACLPVFVGGVALAAGPARYLDEQRCLAVLNVAAAALETLEEPSHAVHALRKDIETGYDRLKIMISAERDLTEQQLDKGLDIFEGEQQHWLDAFGEVNEEPMRGRLVDVLMKKAQHCVKALPG